MQVIIMYKNTFIGGDGWDCYPLAIEISDRCPVCGKPRGKPKQHNFHEDGEWLTVDKWENPCGHLDTYKAAYLEASEWRKLRGLERESVILKIATEADQYSGEEYTFRHGDQVTRRQLPQDEWKDLALNQRNRLKDLEGREILELANPDLTRGLGEYSYFYLEPLTVNDLV